MTVRITLPKLQPPAVTDAEHDRAVQQLVDALAGEPCLEVAERNANEINSTSPVLPTPKGTER